MNKYQKIKNKMETPIAAHQQHERKITDNQQHQLKQ